MSKGNAAKNKGTIQHFVSNNMVVIMFIILCTVCLAVSKTSPSYVLKEVATRFGRNTCLVLALIIPCLAGLGLNFGIVVGATAAQIAVFFIGHWGFTGIGGFLLCILMSTPLAIVFGLLLGRLYNKTKGAEMIAGLVAGFFTDGLYRLFVLYIIGGVIPFDDPNLLERGFGLRNAYDLTTIKMKYAMDDVSLLIVLRLVFILLALSLITKWIYNKKQSRPYSAKLNIIKLIGCTVGFAATFLVGEEPYFQSILGGKRLYLCDAVCLGAIAILVYYAVKLISEKLAHKQINWTKYIWRNSLYCSLWNNLYSCCI
jgi:simple sugar transport system permease protein